MNFFISNLKKNNTFFFMRGREALYTFLKAIGIHKGDEIILQAFTCLAVPTPVIFAGAKAVYIDIDPITYNIDPSLIEGKITKKTKAIIIQHTFGMPADMDNILKIAKENNLVVIEDCCHAIGSKYRGREVGSFGDASFYSSEWAKPLNTGLGGILVVNNPRFINKVDRIYNQLEYPSFLSLAILKFQYIVYTYVLFPSMYWIIRDLYRAFSKRGLIIGTFSKSELEGKVPQYYGSRMSRWQQKKLSKKVKKMPETIIHRNEIHMIYQKLLTDNRINPVHCPGNVDPIYLRYPLLVENKEKILEKAREKRVELGNWFVSPIHPKVEDEWGSLGYHKGSCPHAEYAAEHVINLPIHLKIRKKEVGKISEFISDNTNEFKKNQSQNNAECRKKIRY